MQCRWRRRSISDDINEWRSCRGRQEKRFTTSVVFSLISRFLSVSFIFLYESWRDRNYSSWLRKKSTGKQCLICCRKNRKSTRVSVSFDCTEETCFSRCSVVLKCLSFSCLRVSVSLFRILLFSLLLFSVFRRAIQETEALPTKHTKQEERRRKEGGNKRGERMPFLYCFSTDKTRGK